MQNLQDQFVGNVEGVSSGSQLRQLSAAERKYVDGRKALVLWLVLLLKGEG